MGNESWLNEKIPLTEDHLTSGGVRIVAWIQKKSKKSQQKNIYMYNFVIVVVVSVVVVIFVVVVLILILLFILSIWLTA